MLRQRPDASVDVSGHAFGAFLADRRPNFQREIQEIHFLRNTEIRFENTRITQTGCATRSSRPELLIAVKRIFTLSLQNHFSEVLRSVESGKSPALLWKSLFPSLQI